VRSAATILAIYSDPGAPILRFADVGIVGDWQEIVPTLEDAIRSRPKI
jgi:electron transfer flavoprotein alpha subunit